MKECPLAILILAPGHRPSCTVVLAIRLSARTTCTGAITPPARWSGFPPAARGGEGPLTPNGDLPKAKDQGRKAGPGDLKG